MSRGGDIHLNVLSVSLTNGQHDKPTYHFLRVGSALNVVISRNIAQG